MKYKLLAILSAGLLAGPMAAQAALSIATAAVKNGVAYIAGKGATPNRALIWEGYTVSKAKGINGTFSFYSVLPGDCTGFLSDGVQPTVEVFVLGCTPVTLGGPPALVPQTGAYQDYTGGGIDIGSDADLKKGVVWPIPRFTAANGTVTDNLTGLIWLQDANCSAFGQMNWPAALTAVRSLADGACGLTDGSAAGDWRLPNVRELHSLVDYGNSGQALPAGHPFIGFQSFYMSSTSSADNPTFVLWYVNFDVGGVYNNVDKGDGLYVIAVRGP